MSFVTKVLEDIKGCTYQWLTPSSRLGTAALAIRQRLYGRVSEVHIDKAIDLLLDLKLIRRTYQGTYVATWRAMR